jgi:predicted DNA-binding protein YlxM (UPF0122 family)
MYNICKKCPHRKTCTEDCAFVAALRNVKCKDCPHYHYCKQPCYLAHCFVNQNADPLLEKKKTIVEDGREIKVTVIYTYHKTNYFDVPNDGDVSKNSIENLTNERQAEFWNGVYYTRQKHLGIFIDKFFNDLPDQDLAVKYDCNVDDVHKYYSHAKSRVYEVVENMHDQQLDNRRKNIAKACTKKVYHLSKKQQAFLLYHCFDLSYSDIAEIFGDKRSNTKNINHAITRMENQIADGMDVLKLDDNYKPHKVDTWDIRRQKQCQTA